jgi:hypothetical protein
MNVSNLACLVLLALALGSCKKEQTESTATGSLVTRIVFEGSAGTRAATSTAIPETKWDNIKQIQLFLYEEATGLIKFSDVFTPPTSGGTSYTKTWSMIPEGNYQLVLVANANSASDAIQTTISGVTAPLAWTGMNVRNFAADALGIHYQPLAGGFPSNINTALPPSHTLKPYVAPSEIFMAYSPSAVKIESGKKTTLSGALNLKRDVSLMRLRLRTNDKSKGFDNTQVDFAHADASILIYTLPNKIGIHKENGGVSNTSDEKAVLVAAHGASTFLNSDPSSGYDPKVIISGDFSLWRDIVVFPNDGGRKSGATQSPAQRYYVVVTGRAPAGHVLSDQTKVPTGGALVAWAGLVEDYFSPNLIRELNLTLSSGGSLTIPSTPTKEGGLEIEISAPLPWDTNLTNTDMEL